MATIDNYLRCTDYQGHPASSYEGFTHFFREDSGLWYFAMVAPSGKVLLKSEGYASEAGRNNGIESVIRNRDIEERYDVLQDEGGHWRAILRAGNKQEIARSCGYDDEAGARAHIAMCNSAWVEPAEVAAAAKSVAAAPREAIDDYLPCESYSAMPELPEAGFTGFYSEAHSNYFFSMNNWQGETLLRSEGYQNEAGRDNGVQSVIRNRDIRERYKVWQRPDNTWVVSLNAGNHQEIARSCPFASEAEALAHIEACLDWNYQPVAEKSVAAAPTSAAVHDDYLPCEAYEGKERSAKYPGFTTFREEDGRYFFAMVNDAGKVLLKSEGYPTAAPRDNGIESVMKNRDNRDRWTEKQDEHGYYLSLRAGNNIEIGRTCHYKEAGAWWIWLFPVVVEPVTDKLVAPPPIVVEKKIEVKAEPIIVEKKIEVPPPVVIPPVTVETKKVEVPIYTKPIEEKIAPVVVPPVAAESGGCMRYWWLLPLLLLLAGLLWWLTKDGCGKKAEVPPVKVEVPTPPAPAVETPKPAPPPTCSCTGNQDALFNVPVGQEAKKLTRLGTNPEFGNSHDLDPAGFFAKLGKAAKANAADRAFLDRVFKGMGYATGWEAATADMFSSVVLPVGTSGNLGYSKAHKTGHYTLPDAERDRMAFRIKAANGCDFHFMKTCGNHFFFCPN